MKKIKFCMVILLVMVTFSGCSNRIDLTDEETDMFAEYISMEVLKRDKNYNQGLLEQQYDFDDEDETNTNQSSVTTGNQTATNVGYVTNQTTTKVDNDATVNDVIGTPSISVSYQSTSVYDSYPEESDSYFVIESREGYKILVVNFRLKNKSEKDVSYNMLTSDVNYKLTMENGNTYSPLLTLLVDDLQFIDKVIPAGATEQGVLVFRVAKGEANTNASLKIVYGTQSTTVTIQ